MKKIARLGHSHGHFNARQVIWSHQKDSVMLRELGLSLFPKANFIDVEFKERPERRDRVMGRHAKGDSTCPEP